MNKILIIIGLPGSGKSTAVQNISKRQHVAPFDFDEEMPESLRQKNERGEDYYRRRMRDLFCCSAPVTEGKVGST